MSQSETHLPQTRNDEPQVDTPAKTPKPGAQQTSLLPLIFALLALGVSIGLAVGGYFIWTQLQQLTGEQADMEPRLEQKVQPLQSHLQAISNDWQAGRREIEQQLGTLGDGQAALGERVSQLASRVGRSELGWTLAEVEYLLRVASERRTAIAALKSADARLRELADPQLLPVREQLARELNQLREVPDVDFDGISLQLADDLQRIAGLPVAGSRYDPPEPNTTEFDSTRTAGNWRDLPQVIWSALKELFRVREYDKPVTPMLPPERAWFLKENLRLQLAAARLALLREDQQAYKQALLTATTWLKAWFDSEDPAVTAMAAGLEKLASVDIHPELPDVSKSLQRLRQLQKQQEMPAVPGTEAAPVEESTTEGGNTVNKAVIPETVSSPAEEAPARPEGEQ